MESEQCWMCLGRTPLARTPLARTPPVAVFQYALASTGGPAMHGHSGGHWKLAFETGTAENVSLS